MIKDYKTVASKIPTGLRVEYCHPHPQTGVTWRGADVPICWNWGGLEVCMDPSAEQRERRAACGIQATGRLQMHFTTQPAKRNIVVSNKEQLSQHLNSISWLKLAPEQSLQACVVQNARG